MKLLFPTDFSSTAKNAIDNTIKIFNNKELEVNAIHTYEVASYGASSSFTNIHDLILKEAQKSMTELKDSLSQKDKVSFKSMIEYGGVIIGVKNEVRAHDYDLLVLGTNGADSLSDKWIGTNAMMMSVKADVSSLIIPQEYEYNNEEFQINIALNPDRDYTNELFYKLKYLFGSTSFRLLFVCKNDNYTMEELEAKFVKLSENFDLTVEKVVDEKPIRGINSLLEGHKNELLVLMPNKFSFLDGLFHKSISSQITKMAKTPILVLK